MSPALVIAEDDGDRRFPYLLSAIFTINRRAQVLRVSLLDNRVFCYLCREVQDREADFAQLVSEMLAAPAATEEMVLAGAV